MRRRQAKGVNRYHINLTDEQAAWLDELCEANELSFSAVLGRALKEYYQSHKPESVAAHNFTPMPD